MDPSGGVLLRRVARDRVRQVADELREPFRTDPDQALSVTLTQGDPATAQQALVEWLDYQVKRARREGRGPEEARRLLMEYYRHRATIHGLARTVRTELGLLAECVDEDYGRHPPLPFTNWCTRENLLRLFDTSHGSEVNLIAGKGMGKTNLECTLGLAWVRLGPQYFVLHNVNELRVTDHEEAKRFLEVDYLSDILRRWAELPPDAEVLFLFDEPGQTLKAKMGGGPEVEAWNNFRPQLRKMGITVLYGWQWERQIFKWLRVAAEEGDHSVSTIRKPAPTEMSVQVVVSHQTSRADVTSIPYQEGFRYQTKGWTTLETDVDFQQVILRTKKMTLPEVRAAIPGILQDPDVYTDKYRDYFFPPEDRKRAKNDETQARLEDVRQAIRNNPLQHVGAKGFLTPDSLYPFFGPDGRAGDALTHRQCGMVARELNDELQLQRGRR